MKVLAKLLDFPPLNNRATINQYCRQVDSFFEQQKPPDIKLVSYYLSELMSYISANENNNSVRCNVKVLKGLYGILESRYVKKHRKTSSSPK